MSDLFITDQAYALLVEGAVCGRRFAIARAVAGAGVEPRAELVDAIAAAATPPSIITGGVDRDRIMVALGEVGGIWPEGILPDVTREHIAHLRMSEAKLMAAA